MREVPHIYDNACDSICNECQVEREVAPHVYDNICDENCNECGEIRVAPHLYDNACDSICNECQAEREVAPHIYDNIYDKYCNICNELREKPSGINGDCIWTLNGTELMISGNGKMGDYNYSTETPWGSGITSVIIEDGVTSIGNYAFDNLY